MSDAQLVVVAALFLILLSAIVGGTVGSLIATRRSVEVRAAISEPLTVSVILHADPVGLRVRAVVAEIEPVVVPVVMAAVPSVQEQAARVLARFPEAGPTDIAEITGCAKSSAHAIIQDYRTGFGAAAFDKGEPADAG